MEKSSFGSGAVWRACLREPVAEYAVSLGQGGLFELETIVVIRHAATSANRRGIMIGRSDPPLDEFGRDQADNLASEMRDLPVDKIFASDLKRANATAAIISQAHHLPVSIDARLREVDYGDVDGIASTTVRYHEFLAHRGSDKYHYRPSGGESLLDLEARTRSFLASLFGMRGVKTALVVGHLGTIRTFARILCNLSTRDAGKLEVPHLSVSIVDLCTGVSLWGGRIKGGHVDYPLPKA